MTDHEDLLAEARARVSETTSADELRAVERDYTGKDGVVAQLLAAFEDLNLQGEDIHEVTLRVDGTNLFLCREHPVQTFNLLLRVGETLICDQPFLQTAGFSKR